MSGKKTVKDWEASVEKQLKGAGLASLSWHTPEGIDVKPLYTAEDLERLAAEGYDAEYAAGLRALHARAAVDHVCGPSLDHPPVCRLLDGGRVQRLLSPQPRRRSEGPFGRLRPRDPSRL